MRDVHVSTSDLAWQKAFGITLGVCSLFTSLSFLVYGFGISSTTLNGGLALGFSVALLFAAVKMLTSRGALAALPYFLIGCAFFYGLGTFIATLLPESMYKVSFTTEVQRKMLAQVNAVNIAAISIVVLVAAPICFSAGRGSTNGNDEKGLNEVVVKLERLLPALLTLSIPIVALIWGTFPRPTNPGLQGILLLLSSIPLFTILLGGAVWTRLIGARKLLIVVLIIALSLYGFLILGKLKTILPIVSFCIGLWIFKATRYRAGLIVITTAVVYFAGLAELVNLARLHGTYDPLLNSPLQRLNILWDTSGNMAELASQHYRGVAAQRFSIAPFESHFIALYDSGSPGDSLRNFFNVLIPRVIWPGKPIISPGTEFDLAFRGFVLQSSLAIGFIAEAYWNLGWLGVVLISGMIGLQIGWFTRRWLLFCQHGLSYAGIFFMAPLVLQQSLWVETNIVGSYIGGWIKMMLFIVAIDLAVRLARAIRVRLQRAELDAFPGLAPE